LVGADNPGFSEVFRRITAAPLEDQDLDGPASDNLTSSTRPSAHLSRNRWVDPCEMAESAA
jgi:hypothetical protein